MSGVCEYEFCLRRTSRVCSRCSTKFFCSPECEVLGGFDHDDICEKIRMYGTIVEDILRNDKLTTCLVSAAQINEKRTIYVRVVNKNEVVAMKTIPNFISPMDVEEGYVRIVFEVKGVERTFKQLQHIHPLVSSPLPDALRISHNDYVTKIVPTK